MAKKVKIVFIRWTNNKIEIFLKANKTNAITGFSRGKPKNVVVQITKMRHH